MQAIKTLPSLFCCFLLISSATVHAAGFSEGIPEVVRGTGSLSIRSIAQDSKKQIWFGTDENLYRYDGYTPILCRASDGENDHSQINDLVCLEDKVLLGSVKGLITYDCLEGTFTPSVLLGNVEVFTLYRQGNTVWIGTKAGLYRYDVGTGAVSYVGLDGRPDIRSLKVIGDWLVVGTMRPGEIRVYNMVDFSLYALFPSESFTPNAAAFDALLDLGESHVLAGGSSALFDIDLRGKTVKPIRPFSWVKTLYDDNGRILVGTDNGVFSYDPGNGRTDEVVNNVLWDIFRDADGNVWYGSDTGLLFTGRENLVHTMDVTKIATNNLYSSIRGDGEGRIFAGGSYGLLVFGDGSVDLKPAWYRMGDSEHPISHNKVRMIRQNPYDGRIWVETAASLVSYDKAAGRFTPVSAQNYSQANSFDILFEKDCYWIASFSGLACIKDGVVIDTVTSADGLSSNLVIQVLEDKTGMLWLRTSDQRVFLYNVKERQVLPFQPKGSGIPTTWDLIYADSDGNIWLSAGNRIFRMDPDLSRDRFIGEFYLYGQQAAETNALVEVEGTIWACSTEGLFILDKESGQVSTIASDESYTGMYYDRNSGQVYLGALDRMDVVPSKDALAHIGKPADKLYITRITVNDEEPLQASTYAGGVLKLPHYRNNINIYFSDFSFRNTAQFKFSLNGDSRHWFEASGAGNRVFLPNLSPGHHVLYVSGLNDDAGKPLLSIRILRPWYASVFAFILYGLLGVGFIYQALRLHFARKRIKMERRQRASEIAQAKSKIDFFSDVSHEFKTPLSMIIAPASVLLNDSRDEKTRQALQIIHDNAMKINSLVKMSLDYYNDKAEISEDVTRTSLELVGFARQVMQAFEESFPNLDFYFYSDSEKKFLYLDVIKMEAIFTNLLSNACKYTPDGGSVILSISQDSEADMISIKVSDTGVGIPAEEIPFIFQRYYQSSRTKGDKKGTGLGLSIVKKYVDLLGGEITATSEGVGADIRILLPVSTVPENALVMQDTKEKDEDRNQHIVIVDDNKTVCEFLSGVLKDKYHCLSAHDGVSGLKLCQDVLPDLIIADVAMPDMDGLEMCRRIRQTPDLSIVPIILLTAKDDKDTEKMSISLNIDAFIGKPFDVDTLVARIDQLIDKNRHMRSKLRVEMIANPEDKEEMSPDEKILDRITRIIEENMDDSGFSVTRLCELSGFNEKYLYRKIKGLTGLSTVEYIRSIRMKKAALLLQNGNFTISEAMFMVGFSNTSYFSKAFTAQFGMSPREYRQSFRDGGSPAE